MANVLVMESSLRNIADAIRSKNGTQNTYTPAEMASAIEAISGGGITPTGTIEITQNGVVDVTNYASADVDVPQGTTPTGTKQISITENGTTTEDVSAYANAEITVNVSGGTGYTVDDIVTQTQPSGDIVVNVSSMPTNYLAYRTAMTKITAPNLNITASLSGVFQNCTNLEYAILPKYTKIYNGGFSACSNLIGVDFLGGSLGSTVFSNCAKFNLLIIRKTDAITTISNVNSFSSCCFGSGKTGGTLYVPNDLIASYQANTNWATVLGYNANNQIKSIESTHTDPNAPIDLTTHYIDGTAIPTT